MPFASSLSQPDDSTHDKDRYESLFLNLSTATIIATRQAELIDCNPAACQLFAQNRAELLKRPVTALFGFTSPLSFNQVVARLESQPQLSTEVVVRRLDGDRLAAQAHFTRLGRRRDDEIGITIVQTTPDAHGQSKPIDGKTLLRVSSVAVSSGDLKTRLQTIADQVAEAVRADRVSLITCD
ncbi:MAG TPA: PAS domain-containing protein, partial [Anaerolineales bacterium]|nr:PAS domain-containing protein [Anaerolineales bacterium]